VHQWLPNNLASVKKQFPPVETLHPLRREQQQSSSNQGVQSELYLIVEFLTGGAARAMRRKYKVNIDS